MIHIVLTSDSLSFPRPWNQKLLTDQPEQFFRFQDTYPFLIRENLRRIFAGTDVVFSNMGRRAASVGHVTNVTRDILAWMSPDFTIVHHGIVDCWIREAETLSRRTSEQDFENTLREFFELRKTLAPRQPVAVVGILDTNSRMLGKFPQQNDFVRDYNDILRSLASEYDAHFVAYNNVDEPFRLVHEDGHHLSRLGHARLAEALTEVIAEELSAPREI